METNNTQRKSNLVLLDHQLLQNNRALGIEKINSKEVYSVKEIYSVIISSKVNTPTSRTYFEKKFLSIIFNGNTYAHFHVRSL